MGAGRLGDADRGGDGTERIRLGTMLTPLPRIRPWELAGRVATLDALSGGRVQLAVGMGALHDGWLAFERDEGRQVRAEKLDEGLAVYDGLMRGQPFEFTGTHYQVHPTASCRRRRRCNGPGCRSGWSAPTRRRSPCAGPPGGTVCWPPRSATEPRHPFGPADLAEVVAAVRPLREAAGLPWDGYQVVAEGVSPPGSPVDAMVRTWVDAGATFWVESDWSMGPDAVQRHRARIEAGPPGR